jgi:tripartite-type tricarboxylate transporter receptor subunit TctC
LYHVIVCLIPHPGLPARAKRLSIPIATLVFVLFAGVAFSAPAAERPSASSDQRAVAEFYRGKVVRVVVGFPPGGGADVYSRLLARYLGLFIPGNPKVAVTNMPGAGSIIAGNHIFNAGATDGTEIGMLNGAVILEQLFSNSAVQFDMARFRYLAVPVTEIYVMIVARRSGITKFSDLIGAKAKQAILGAIPNSTLEHAPILLRDALNANIKVVSGYKGSADIRLAIDSGEIGGFFNPWSTVKASSFQKFTSGEWSVILQLSDRSLPDLPSPNVPMIADVTADESQRMLLRYGTLAPNQFGKVYMLRPGVPADRAAALEAAFARTFAEPNFQAEAEKSQLEISPLYGDSIRQIVADFLTMPPAIKERLKRSLKP